jgi:hypothetical protein
MNPKIYSNIDNYLIIYTPKVILWGQTDKQTNKWTDGWTDRQTNIYSIFRDKLSLPQGSSDNQVCTYQIYRFCIYLQQRHIYENHACEPFQEPWPCNHLLIHDCYPTNECFEILLLRIKATLI